jgi:conflict system pore-forming effector with SLATT domain
MFSLTIVDHVRLDSEHIDKNYIVHARSAERSATAVFACRIVIVALLAVATSVTIASLLLPGRNYQIAAVVATTLALVAFATYAVLGLEARLYARRSFIHRLWIVSERYRSLLAEVQEGMVDNPTLLRRRDELIRDVHAIYEFGFGVDQDGHESVRLPAMPDQRAA